MSGPSLVGKHRLSDPDWTGGDASDLAGLIVVVILIAIIVVLCFTFNTISTRRENRAFRRGYVAAVDSVRARAHGSMRDTTRAYPMVWRRAEGPDSVWVSWTTFRPERFGVLRLAAHGDSGFVRIDGVNYGYKILGSRTVRLTDWAAR